MLIGSREKNKLKAQPSLRSAGAMPTNALIIINIFSRPFQEGDAVDRTADERLLMFNQMTGAGIL